MATNDKQCPRLNSAEYKNWLKVGQALLCLRNGLCKYAKDLSLVVHDEVWRNANIQPPQNCGVCIHKDIQFQSKQWVIQKKGSPAGCPNRICDKVLPEITKLHKNKNNKSMMYWANTHVEKWNCDDWEIAKVYMGRGQRHHQPEECDASNLLNFFNMCQKCNIQNKKILRDILEERNKLMHSSTLEVNEKDMKQALDKMITLLKDEAELKQYPQAQQALKEIDDLKDLQFDITSAEWKDREVQLIREKMQELENRLSSIETKEDRDNEKEAVDFTKVLMNFMENNDNLSVQLQREFEDFKNASYRFNELDGRVDCIEDRLGGIEGIIGNQTVVAGANNNTAGIENFRTGMDYKGRLNNYAQTRNLSLKFDSFQSQTDNNWIGKVTVGDKVFKSKANHLNTKEAQQEAAYQALIALGYYKEHEDDVRAHTMNVTTTNFTPVTPLHQQPLSAVTPSAATAGSTTTETQITDSAQLEKLNTFLRSLKFRNASCDVVEENGKFRTSLTVRVTNCIGLENSVKGKKPAEQELAKKIIEELFPLDDLDVSSYKEKLHSHCGKRGLSKPCFYTYEDKKITQNFYCIASMIALKNFHSISVEGDLCVTQSESITSAAREMEKTLNEVNLEAVVNDDKSTSNSVPTVSTTTSDMTAATNIDLTNLSTTNTSSPNLNSIANKSLLQTNSNDTEKNYVSLFYEYCQKSRIESSNIRIEAEQDPKSKEFMGRVTNFRAKIKLPIDVSAPGPKKQKDAEKDLACHVLKEVFNEPTSDRDRSKGRLQEICVKYKQNNIPKYDSVYLETGFSSEVTFEIPVEGRNWHASKQSAKCEAARIALEKVGEL